MLIMSMGRDIIYGLANFHHWNAFTTWVGLMVRNMCFLPGGHRVKSLGG